MEDRVAALSGAAPDPEALALRLLYPPMTATVRAERTFWRTVHAVPPQEALVWERDGRRGPAVRWWRPPVPNLSLTEAAAAVRTALTDAVGTCTAGGGTVSADLSGGLDSTSRQLNPTGALVLRLLLRGATAEDAATALAERCPQAGPAVGEDVARLLTALRGAGLLRE